jgi:hypothetical protein
MVRLGAFRFILKKSLTRRAKHWQNGIIEKYGSARAKQSAAGFLFPEMQLLI